MKILLILMPLLLAGVSVSAQNPAKPPVPPSIVSVVEGVTGQRFLPDTAFAALSDDDEKLIAKEPVANWGLPQESDKNISYYNLVIGTRSYQLIIVKPPKDEFAKATLLRFVTPKSKPEPIARGTLKPKEEKAK